MSSAAERRRGAVGGMIIVGSDGARERCRHIIADLHFVHIDRIGHHIDPGREMPFDAVDRNVAADMIGITFALADQRRALYGGIGSDDRNEYGGGGVAETRTVHAEGDGSRTDAAPLHSHYGIGIGT